MKSSDKSEAAGGKGHPGSTPAAAKEPANKRSEDSDSDSEEGLPSSVQRILDIEVPVRVSFGATTRSLGEILQLAPGTRLELDSAADEPVVLTVNNKVFARGEVVVVEGHYGVRIHESETAAERLASLGE